MALYVKAGSSKTSKRFRRSKNSLPREGNAEELLPGIPDEISLGVIVPKLSWKTSHVLAAVSPNWLRAIRSHQVYEGRVHSHSTEKFYVFKHGFASEVFDPKSRSWSLRKPMPSIRYDHKVAMLGEELLVYGGKTKFMLGGELAAYYAEKTCDRSFDAESLEVYNPVEDKWREVGCFPNSLGGRKATLFTSQGEIYAMTVRHIYIYKEKWKKMHWCRYDGVEEWDHPIVIGAVENDNGLSIGIQCSKRVGRTSRILF